MHSKQWRKIVGLCAVAPLALGLAACGDDDGPERLSTEEFLQQGNSICSTAEAKLDEGFGQLSASGEPEVGQLQRFMLDTVIPNVDGQIEGLRTLQAPEELEADVAALLADADEALKQMRTQIETDPELFFDEGTPDPFAEVNARAAELGLEACAS